MKAKRLKLGVLLLLCALIGLTFLQRQQLKDWLKLRSYQPSAVVSGIADQTTMTQKARTLFYVNRPVITSSDAFTRNCPVGGEKTVVLGCYRGNDAGIFVYDVRDARLNGVEQVTSAHEMLHAGYRRLSSAERTRVNRMLTDYYTHDLKDARIKTVIEAYKKSEPNDVINEMHSIFGTEITNLPTDLEEYYARYFTRRSAVTALTAKYQREFTSREEQVSIYDAQLKSLKIQIDVAQTKLESIRAALDKQNQDMQGLRSKGQNAAYNESVASYNQAVNEYNSLLDTTKAAITQYNDIVAARNKIALEERQLTDELSSSTLQN